MMYCGNEQAQGTGQLTFKNSRGVCTNCGNVFNTELYVHISDQDEDAFSLLAMALETGELCELNTANCSCGSEFKAEHPLTVHLTKAKRLIIFVPASQSMWAHEVMSYQLLALSARAQVSPETYFAQPELCVGSAALQMALDGTNGVGHHVPLQSRLSSQSRLSYQSLKAPSITPASELIDEPDPLDELLDEALDQETTGIYDLSASRPASVQMSQHLTALDAFNPATIPPILPENTTEEGAELSQTAVNLLQGAMTSHVLVKEEVTRVDIDLNRPSDHALQEPLDGPTDLTKKNALKALAIGDEDQTFIQNDLNDVEANDVETEIKDIPASTELLYSNSVRHFDHEAARQGNTYLKIVGDVIEAAALLDERQAEGWLLSELDIRAQLHFVEGGGAAPCLTLFSVQEGLIEDELYWPIEVDGALGPKILRKLRREFKFELTLYKKNGHQYGQRVIEAPLEDNVGYILSAIKRLQMTPKQAARALFEVSAEEFDRDGRMKHSFEKDSYVDIEHAAEAKLATGIWGYWSTVKQRDYLLLVKSFPLSWLRRVQHRILKAGLDYGIAMPSHLQSQAIALRLAKSDVELLQRLVANFAEVSLKLKGSQLSAEDEWENWDALLAQVDELGIPVDEEIEQLAFQAMERAGLNGESLFDEVLFDEVIDNQAEVVAVDSIDILAEDEMSPVQEPELISDDLIEEELIDGDLLDFEMIDEDLIEEEELLEADDLIDEDLDLIEDSVDGEV